MGTAPRVDIWFLLAYAGPWGEKALDESRLPGPVKEWASAQVKTLPNARLLLISQGRQPAGGRLPFFIYTADQPGGKLYETGLQSYKDLLSLDVSRILTGHPPHGSRPHPHPVYLVCTNGRRDACCAREGLPVYRALRARVGDQAWQCTHVGGHRFAANVLVFPAGLCYGRLSAGDADALITATARGETLTGHLRGRACYEPVAQAAEIHLRQLLDAPQSGRFRFQEADALEDNLWRVRFTDLDEATDCRLDLQIIRSTDQAYQSCKGDKQAPSLAYRLVDYRILHSQAGPNPG